jgi:hypothetical protein
MLSKLVFQLLGATETCAAEQGMLLKTARPEYMYLYT